MICPATFGRTNLTMQQSYLKRPVFCFWLQQPASGLRRGVSSRRRIPCLSCKPHCSMSNLTDGFKRLKFTQRVATYLRWNLICNKQSRVLLSDTKTHYATICTILKCMIHGTDFHRSHLQISIVLASFMFTFQNWLRHRLFFTIDVQTAKHQFPPPATSNSSLSTFPSLASLTPYRRC